MSSRAARLVVALAVVATIRTAPIMTGRKCVSPTGSHMFLCFNIRTATPPGGPGVLSSVLQAPIAETRG